MLTVVGYRLPAESGASIVPVHTTLCRPCRLSVVIVSELCGRLCVVNRRRRLAIFYKHSTTNASHQITNSMTSEREKCGLTSFLPMSCRGRAEAFARRLQTRLSSLGSHDDNGSANESSWLAAHENPIAISQPRHSSDNEIYLDFALLESPGSPDEIDESELHRLINKDNLKHSHSSDCHCPKAKEKKINLINSFKATSNDSDSDGSFYDTENDIEQRIINRVNSDPNSESSKSQDSETGIYVSSQETSNQEESFATTSDCTPQPSSSLSEDVSTLSLRDCDYPSLETNGSFVDLPKYESETVDDILCVSHEGEIEEENQDINCTPNNTEVELICSNENKETIITAVSIEKDLANEYPDSIETSEQIHDVIHVSKDEDDDEEEERPPRVRRCSSLKTGKTPPGTPSSKKIVRFADALGLDLADVRTFLDEIPKVPISAYEDLTDVDLSDSSSNDKLVESTILCHGVKTDRILMPLFQQPGGQPNFMDLVRDKQVCLENAYVEDPLTLSIKGIVRVRNLDFHKSVHIRYTLDSWMTFADVQGVYVENSCDGFSDKFSFLIYAHTLSVGQRIEFACRFQCKGCQYWDSNNGANYCFQCLPSSNTTPVVPIIGVDDWGASFY